MTFFFYCQGLYIIFLSQWQENTSLPDAKREIRAGINREGYSHILSFRRQAFIEPKDMHKIQIELVIEYEGTQYRIYTSIDKINCFLCQELGHIARFFPKKGRVVHVVVSKKSDLLTQATTQ